MIFTEQDWNETHPPVKTSELHARDDGLDFYLGDLREKFFQAFKGDLAPLRSALEVALAEKSEPEQREALIALKPQLPELLNTFISEGISARILAKAIARAFTEGWHQPKTEVADSMQAAELKTVTKAARDVKVGDLLEGRRIRRVQMNRKEWNHVRLYFDDGGSTMVRRETLFQVVPRESIEKEKKDKTDAAKSDASGTGEAGQTLTDGHWVTINGEHVFIKGTEQ